MAIYEQDPDVVRWGLHLLDVCSLTSGGPLSTVSCYDEDLSHVEYVREGYSGTKPINVENDEIIAHTFQEELSQIAAAESAGSPDIGNEHKKESILAQDWFSGCSISGQESHNEDEDEREKHSFCLSPEELSFHVQDQVTSPEVANESILDDEVEKRLNNMVPVPHVPRTNGQIPSVDEAISDHQRLLERLQVYDLVELKVSGDGNCQFRSLSDQIYRTPEHHKFVREQVVDQLKSYPELYEGYIPMSYDDYLKKMSKTGEWGDHVTLQAAADTFGVKIFILTSFKDTCYIEIVPHIQKSERIIFLSFWAEVHYNSIYPLGEFPEPEAKKKKRWWQRIGN